LYQVDIKYVCKYQLAGYEFHKKNKGDYKFSTVATKKISCSTNLSTMKLTCPMLSILKLVCKLQTTHQALAIVVRILETRECKTGKFCLPMFILNTPDLSNWNVQHMVKSKLLQKSLGHLPCTKLENIHTAVPLKITLCTDYICITNLPTMAQQQTVGAIPMENILSCKHNP
jgi:hypothetical protein